MDFEQYAHRILELVGAVATDGPLTPERELYDDIGLDSFQAFQLIIATESLANVDMPPIDIPQMFTLGDAYAYYAKLRAG